MEMEFMPEFTDDMSQDRDRKIIKGKRTKRQRPNSPFGDCLIDNSTTPDDQSPVMSSEISTSEEDEDMANCLIMLAHSTCVISPVNEENSKSDQIRQKREKLSSRRLTEMTTATTGKSGFYVYECKTCNRTFPSFQALGGHRASHKKPKPNVEEKKSSSVNISPPSLTEYSEAVVEDEENKVSIINVQKSPSRSPGFIQTGSINTINSININNNNKSKVHECSICGSEFLSGQALGGHMRKHRPIPASVNRTSGSSGGDIDHVIEKSPVGSSSNTTMLSLDLNLPPPEMVDDVQSPFKFTASSSQQRLLFSATPALVDCHY